MNDIYNRKDEEFTVIGEVPESLKLNDPLYKEGFQAGAASRDAEVAALQAEIERKMSAGGFVLKENDQLREQVQLLREALEYSVKQVPELGTVPGIANALAATEPKL